MNRLTFWADRFIEFTGCALVLGLFALIWIATP